jgi:hypothetical protein
VVDAPKGVVGRVDEVEKAGDTRLSLPSFIDKGHTAQYVQAQAKSHQSQPVTAGYESKGKRSAAMRQRNKPRVTLGNERSTR